MACNTCTNGCGENDFAGTYVRRRPCRCSVCAAFGGLFESGAAISLTTVPTAISLQDSMPFAGVAYGENTITVLADGIYEISFSLGGTSSAQTLISVNARRNGDTIPGAQAQSDMVSFQAYASAFVPLAAEDIISLTATAASDVTLAATSAFLTIKKVS